MWAILERLLRRFGKYLPWRFKYNFGKNGIGGLDISIDRHFEYAFVISRLKDHKRGLLVDVGGAGSLLSPMLAGLGFKVTGYDLYPWDLRYPNYIHCVGDAAKMNFEDNFVDVCISVSCIEHIGTPRYSSSLMSTDRMIVEEIFRILKPGGIFIITIPFGEARILSTHRVYDDNSLKKLTEGFNELDREIYVPYNDEDVLLHYRISTKEKALSSHPKHSYSVIALKLQKP
jgi:SAM-dependent methyltransferase